MRRYTDLFFMGAAFLLLETKNVVQFALLFGTTWFVNAARLRRRAAQRLAAVEVAGGCVCRPCRCSTAACSPRCRSRGRCRRTRCSRSRRCRDSSPAVAIAFAPIFVANLVFAERFAAVGSSTVAFAANLLGAMVGGVLEYLALVTGYRFLLVIVAVLYGLAFLAFRLVGSEAPPRRLLS